MAIRNSVKAIIVKDGKVLLTTNEDAEVPLFDTAKIHVKAAVKKALDN